MTTRSAADDLLIFHLPLSAVRVIVPTLGGSYGSKCYLSIEPLTAVLAYLTRRTVRLQLSHEEQFVTITKHDDRDWTVLKPAILGVIMEHFTADKPVVLGADAAADENFDAADSEIVDQIKELLDTRVRPAVAQDGGDIVFRGFEKGVVYLHMQGSCSGCPSSTATLKMGIENMLKHYIPEVTEVRAVM